MTNLRIDNRIAHIGYVLTKRTWGNGYATEILKSLMTYALTLPEVDRVEVFCDIENKASSRVMEKAGMTFKETKRKAIVHPNISPDPRDVLVYEKEK
jgi:ribosomal-protein-alanine N-acetyltransferase